MYNYSLAALIISFISSRSFEISLLIALFLWAIIIILIDTKRTPTSKSSSFVNPFTNNAIMKRKFIYSYLFNLKSVLNSSFWLCLSCLFHLINYYTTASGAVRTTAIPSLQIGLISFVSAFDR